MSALVTDTHPLVWYITNQVRKLPRKVKKSFDEAVEGRKVIWVPMPVLWELSILLRLRRFTLSVPLAELVSESFFARSLSLLDLEAMDIVRAHELTFTSDPFDALIVASAQRLELPLITTDELITNSAACPVFWD